MIKERLLYEIPDRLLGDVLSGKAGLVGALIKDAASGKILGHVQPSAASSRVLEEVLTALGHGFAAAAFNPLEIVTTVQNEQIKARLREVNAILGQVQALNIANLILTGIGIGVTVAGFAAVLRKLQGIEKRIIDVENAIHRLEEKRQTDETLTALGRLRAHLNRAGDLEHWKEPIAPNAGLHADLEVEWNILMKCFNQIVRDKTRLDDADREFSYAIMSAMRLCSDSIIRVLYFFEELNVAQRTAARLAEDYLLLGEELAIDDLSRRSLHHGGAGKLLKTGLIEEWQCVVGAIRDNAENCASQSIIAKMLAERGASGRQYITEANSETQKAFLYLPASADAFECNSDKM